mgnify:CR=1 FL=1
MSNIYRYYVEGECEAKFINTFKTGKNPKFISGKVEVFNINTEKITPMRLINMSRNTTIILIYDTDKPCSDIFDLNIKQLKENKNISNIIHVQSVANFEDEIVRHSNISSINDFFHTEGIKNFKHKFVISSIEKRFSTIDFDFSKVWTSKPTDASYSKYKNSSNKIKIKK